MGAVIPHGGLGTGEFAEVEIFRKESQSHTVGLELLGYIRVGI